MENNIYVCVPEFVPSTNTSGGAGYEEGKILKDRYGLVSLSYTDGVIWPCDGDINLGVYARALRPATPEEVVAYFCGIRNIKDIESYSPNYEIF